MGQRGPVYSKASIAASTRMLDEIKVVRGVFVDNLFIENSLIRSSSKRHQINMWYLQIPERETRSESPTFPSNKT